MRKIAIFHNGDYKVFSSGGLETALAEGYEVWIITYRYDSDYTDNWWRELVDSDHIIKGDPNSYLIYDAVERDKVELAPWREVFRVIGIEFPEGQFTTWRGLMFDLDRFGIKPGFEFDQLRPSNLVRKQGEVVTQK